MSSLANKMIVMAMKVLLHRFLMKSQKVRKNQLKKGFQIRKNKAVSIYLRICKLKKTISKINSMVLKKNSQNGDKNMTFRRQRHAIAERLTNLKGRKD